MRKTTPWEEQWPILSHYVYVLMTPPGNDAQVRAERERCARVAEKTRGTGRAIAAAIRAQG